MKRKILKTTLLTALPALTLASSCVMLTSCKNNDIWQGRAAYLLDNEGNKVWFTNLSDSKICISHNDNDDSPDDIVADNGEKFVRADFNKTLILNPSLTAIDQGFLRGCSSFNQVVHIPNSVTIIHADFLAECSAFSSKIGFSNKLEVIGSNFLLNCSSFNKPIDLPMTIKVINDYFMCGLNMMESSVNVHHMNVTEVFESAKNSFTLDESPTHSIIIKTFSKEVSKAFSDYFPNSTAEPFRNLTFDPAPTQK